MELARARNSKKIVSVLGYFLSFQIVILAHIWVCIMGYAETSARALESAAPGAGAASVGPRLPPHPFLLSSGYSVPPAFAAMTAETTTVAEEVQRLNAARLMRRFKAAVTGFLVASILAFCVPVYAYDTRVGGIVWMTWNALALALLCALAWVFRVQPEGDVYLALADNENDSAALDTRVRSTSSMFCASAPV
jgi:hypothetical protein